MLVLPRTYYQARAELHDGKKLGIFGPLEPVGWHIAPEVVQQNNKMLLVHQTGSVKVGEVVRYTLTYTPSHDRILPPPPSLYIRVRNTSGIALRAAYLRGPYTLYAACYPSTFNADSPHESCWEHGAPEFEPNLKAGGSWMGRLTVPETIRDTATRTSLLGTTSEPAPSCTWIIEISSQVIFSASANVHYELLVSRDEKSLEVGFGSLIGQGPATPGQLEDHQLTKRGTHSAAQAKGVFSQAIKLVVEDTAALWNKPAMPDWPNKDGKVKPGSSGLVNGEAVSGKVEVEGQNDAREIKPRKRRKVHLVVLSHGLHSNLGADMLYLKETIDATAKKAKEERRERKRRDREKQKQSESGSDNGDDKTSTDKSREDVEEDDEDDDEEEVRVRGFANNVCRTERGIQYLGKRLAKWILSMTYPDQPFLPAKKSVGRKISRVFTGQTSAESQGTPEHKGSSIYKPSSKKPEPLPYQITSISFIAHSLGGLTQAYAIAYIHKHSPNFFNEIKPINFVTLAAPWLGLSNENPLYVRFALDFGLVGRTGQDLGLTWKSTTALRGGWDSMIAGIGSDGQRAPKQADPGSKPLLRILPTGHTHQVLKMFRNRTVYSNVVNDGIVPLRTSCLLFLDWSGLGRVEKARRENGLVAGLAGWGWAELTGANASSRHLRAEPDSDAWSQSNISGDGTRSRSRSRSRRPSSRQVPQPEEKDLEDDNTSLRAESPKQSQFLAPERFNGSEVEPPKAPEPEQQPAASPLAGFLSLFRPGQNKTNQSTPSSKQSKIYKRSQTVRVHAPDADTGNDTDKRRPASPPFSSPPSAGPSRRPSNVRGDSILDEPQDSMVGPPPKTTIFESAGDILNPPLPSQEFIMDPSSRPRTIFHDRVYHPEDIPPPPQPKKPRLKSTVSSEKMTAPKLMRANTVYGDDDATPTISQVNVSANGNVRSTTANPNSSNGIESEGMPDVSGMKVEEKIARAYHHGLSWRKVLVRLEPDAHNNMVVRRMFANAYGWPVIRHLVDTHFGDTYEARTADRAEPGVERAGDISTSATEPRVPRDVNIEKDDREVNAADESTGSEDASKEGDPPKPKRTDSEVREATDSVPELKRGTESRGSSLNTLPSPSASSTTTLGLGKLSLGSPTSIHNTTNGRNGSRANSVLGSWDDDIFEGGDTDSESESNPTSPTHHGHRIRGGGRGSEDENESKGTSEGEIAAFLHRGARTPPPPSLNTKTIPNEGEGGKGVERGSGMVETTLTASPKSTGGSLGLGKSVEEAMGSALPGRGVKGKEEEKQGGREERVGEEEEEEEANLGTVIVENGR